MHICQVPEPIRTVNPNVPKALSDMISKLMEKNADCRYQSTKGIMHDLDLIIFEYENDNQLSSVDLMQHDILESLIVPQKLYGHLCGNIDYKTNEWSILDIVVVIIFLFCA